MLTSKSRNLYKVHKPQAHSITLTSFGHHSPVPSKNVFLKEWATRMVILLVFNQSEKHLPAKQADILISKTQVLQFVIS